MLRFAILGAGHGASVYMPALETLGHKCVILAAQTAKPGLAIAQTADWRAAIAQPDVDAVIVALPPGLQREAVLTVAASRKPFICEKPAGLNAADTRAMLVAAQQAGQPHAVGYQFRYEPAFAQLRRMIASGAVGTIERIEIDWCAGTPQSRDRIWSWRNDAAQGGGVILNFSTHVLDYLRWCCGDLVMRGRAAQVLIAKRKDKVGAEHAVTAPDSCDFLLGFGSNGITSVRITNLATHPSGHRVVARGDCGTIELWHRPPFRDRDMSLSLFATDGKQHSGEVLGMVAVGSDSRIGPTISLVADFARAVAGVPAPDLPTLRDALAVQALLA